jgi:hypothetical protein
MTTPSDTQSLILSRAATRPGNLALPLPEGLVGAAAKMVVCKMIARRWLEEVEANLRRGEPMWRETGDGHGTTLIATEAGLEAIGIAPATAMTTSTTQGGDQVAKPPTPRAGTKQAQLIAMLQQSDGATMGEIVAATLWMPHTVRGAISGMLKKKLGLSVTTGRIEGRGTVYRIDGPDT